MKKHLVILGYCLLGGLLFYCGFTVGINTDANSDAYSSNLNQTITEASELYLIIYLLDNDRLDEARSSINITLDGLINVIGVLSQDCPDKDTQRVAESLLHRISELREKHAPFYVETFKSKSR